MEFLDKWQGATNDMLCLVLVGWVLVLLSGRARRGAKGVGFSCAGLFICLCIRMRVPCAFKFMISNWAWRGTYASNIVAIATQGHGSTKPDSNWTPSPNFYPKLRAFSQIPEPAAVLTHLPLSAVRLTDSSFTANFLRLLFSCFPPAYSHLALWFSGSTVSFHGNGNHLSFSRNWSCCCSCFISMPKCSYS